AGVDLNRPTKKGFLPIHTAAGRCNGKFLKFLIESGADPEAPTKTGTTPLMQAIKLRNLDATHFLLEQNVSVSSIDRYGYDSMLYLLAEEFSMDGHIVNIVEYKYDDKKDIALRLIQKGAPLNREYKDGRTPLFLILNDNSRNFFLDYFQVHQIDLNVPNRFGVTPFQYHRMWKELYDPENKDKENRINRFLLEQNSKNPTFAFYYIYLLYLHQYEVEVQDTALRKIYSSLLDLPKLPDFKRLELMLWIQIFAMEDPDLKKKLLSRFPDPPAGFWSWISFDEDHPADPEVSALWVRSIQKGNTITPFHNDHDDKLRYHFNDKIDVGQGIYDAFNKCDQWYLLDQLSSQTSLWKFVDPNQFWENYQPHCVTGEKEETMVFRLFQSTPSSAKIVSPLCEEIEILGLFSDEETNKESRQRIQHLWGRQVEVAKEIERSRKRILNFVKMGAKPSCRFESSRHWLTLSKALETVRKYKLKDLEKIILSFDAKDPQKIQKAIAAGDRSKIQNLLEQGAIIGVEELKLAQKNPRLLSYLLEEYNSFDSPPVFDTIDHFKEQGTELLSLLIQKGFSLKVLSKEQYGFQGRRDCAIAGILLSDFHPLQSLLRPELFAGYSCRGGFDLAFHQWLHPSISNSWSQEKIKTKIKALQLESVFPDLWEESYFFEPKS
ncbi:ankyrin repeat domain-containing protein, partial [Leptospira santarosai]